jgi:nitroreductase
MMNNNQLYEAIFHRKSIRKYDMTPLPAAVLSDLQEFAGKVKPLDEKIRYAFSVLGPDDVKSLLAIKAPHYILLYSERKDNYLMNAGFVMQQINLYLAANDLGACWLGMAKPSKQGPQDGLKFVIMMAFGKAVEPAQRAGAAEFKRNSLSSISDMLPGMSEILEPVQLAPSGINTQPWYFSGDTNEITVSRRKLNLIKEPLYGKMNQIDIGIALCHLWLSLDHQNKNAVFDFADSAAPSGYEFMAKVSVAG